MNVNDNSEILTAHAAGEIGTFDFLLFFHWKRIVDGPNGTKYNIDISVMMS